MQKVYYNWMKNTYILAATLVLWPALAALSSPATENLKSQSGGTRPLTTASLDSHEGLTVAADPWLSADRYKPTFPKKTPLGAGVVAIKVTFRNDSDESIKIGIDRIRLNLTFDDNNRQELPALSSELLADTVLHPKLKGTSRPRLPIPLPTSPGGRDKKLAGIQKTRRRRRTPRRRSGSHSTVAGLLYFDLQNQFELLQKRPPIHSRSAFARKNQTLMYFDIDLSHPPPH